MVLVDSSHENQSARMPEAMRRVDELWLQMAKIGRVLAPLGYARLVLPPAHAKLPADLQPVERALMLRTPHVVTMCEELLNLSVSDGQMAGSKLPPGVPLAVLSASRWQVGAEILPEDAAAALAVWRELQADLARKSTNSSHLVVADSGHDMPFDQPAIVVEAIRAVVEAARTQTRLVALRGGVKSE